MRARSVFVALAAGSLLLGLGVPTYAVQRDVPRAALIGADRHEADAALARPLPPGGHKRSCTPRICVHWISAAVDQTDTNPANGVPDYVDKVRSTVDFVHRRYVAAGYRAPERDGRRGGDGRTDIYIRNVGARSIYGFCDTEKQFRPNGPTDAWAYCVLDNDYLEPVFTNHTQLENIQVAAAHVYFHAVQFAYDAREDGWFMEATATWAEDELFDDVNDNLQYLPDGPLGRPAVPLDEFEEAGRHQFGDWIWFRYLTERFPASAGGMPTLVRSMWRLADGSRGGPDQYSLQAVRSVLSRRGAVWGTTFARFADANRRPAETYAEGAANSYPTAPLWTSAELSAAQPTTGPEAVVQDHLSSSTIQLSPSGLAEPNWRLRINVDMADKIRGSVALVTEYPLALRPKTSVIGLGRVGGGSIVVPFSSSDVSRVEVTLVNASTRFSCGAGSPYSCSGTPRDDNLTQQLTATAFQQP